MALERNTPNTIHLSGTYTLVNDLPAGEAGILPGDHIVQSLVGGTPKWIRATTSDNIQDPWFALDQSEMNLGVTTTYGSGDLVKAAQFHVGATFRARVPLGQTVAQLVYLQSNGAADAGTLKVASDQTAAANVSKYRSTQAYGAVTEETLVEVEVLGG